MQTIIDAWFVQGMIKATSDAWLKGWDERNGGNPDAAPRRSGYRTLRGGFPRQTALYRPEPADADTG